MREIYGNLNWGDIINRMDICRNRWGINIYAWWRLNLCRLLYIIPVCSELEFSCNTIFYKKNTYLLYILPFICVYVWSSNSSTPVPEISFHHDIDSFRIKNGSSTIVSFQDREWPGKLLEAFDRIQLQLIN